VRRLLAGAAVVACILAVTIVALLPPRALVTTPLPFQLAWPVVRGAYHVHSERSDGTGTLDEIAAAAAAAGLQFVIVTDHGNGTRKPEPPAYRSGVLCIDGVEISTQYGHYVALGLPRTPYPLAGHPREVIEDVRRLGGFGFAAHPGSPKAALRWDDWEAPFDGLEWLNADSEWRDEFWGSLGRVLLTYAFRPTETLAGLLDRPEAVLQQWDKAVSRRRVVGIAGADAHARLGLRQTTDPYDDRVLARVPSYEVSFAAFTNHAVLDIPLTGDATVDASLVLSAVREGRVFTSIDGLARLAMFEAKASSGRVSARIGEYLDVQEPVTIEAWIGAPEGTSLVVYRDGVAIYDTAGDTLRLDVGDQPGAYRIEAWLPSGGRPTVPWILTNPFYVGMRARHEHAANQRASAPVTSRTSVATGAWRAEASDGSTSSLAAGSMEDGTPALVWQFTLSGEKRGEPFAAMRFPAEHGLAVDDRLQLRLQSDAPRRIWAQIRAPGQRGGERWGRAVYIDESLRAIDLRFEDFRPLGPVSSERPPADRIDSLLLVVDTLNSVPGASGTIRISDLWLAR
jgi:hypothetical protein